MKTNSFGKNDLHYLILYGRGRFLQRELEASNKNINARETIEFGGHTFKEVAPIHLAVFVGSFKKTLLLLGYGAEAACVDGCEKKPINYFNVRLLEQKNTQKQAAKILKLLFENGEDCRNFPPESYKKYREIKAQLELAENAEAWENSGDSEELDDSAPLAISGLNNLNWSSGDTDWEDPLLSEIEYDEKVSDSETDEQMLVCGY